MALSVGVLSSSILSETSPAAPTMVGLTGNSSIILVTIAESSGGQVDPCTITDNGANSWVKDADTVQGGGGEFNHVELWRQQSVGGSPPGTLTITIHTAGDFGRIFARAIEVIGLAASPFDGFQTGAGGSNSAAPSAYTPAGGSGDYIIIGAAYDADNISAVFTAPGGIYTEMVNNITGKPFGSIVRSLQNSYTSGSFTPTWPIGSSPHWAAIVAGYKGAAGGGGGRVTHNTRQRPLGYRRGMSRQFNRFKRVK